EQHLAGRDDDEEQRDGHEVAVVPQEARCGEGPGEAEEAGRLVGGGQRADVAPQPGSDEEQQRQDRHDEAPEDEQPGRRLQHEHHAQAQERADAEQPDTRPEGRLHHSVLSSDRRRWSPVVSSGNGGAVHPRFGKARRQKGPSERCDSPKATSRRPAPPSTPGGGNPTGRPGRWWAWSTASGSTADGTATSPPG